MDGGAPVAAAGAAPGAARGTAAGVAAAASPAYDVTERGGDVVELEILLAHE